MTTTTHEYGLAAIHEEQARISEINKLQYLQVLKEAAQKAQDKYRNALLKY